MKEKEAYSGLNFSLELSRYPQPSPSKTHAESQDFQFHPDTGVVTKAGKNRRTEDRQSSWSRPTVLLDAKMACIALEGKKACAKKGVSLIYNGHRPTAVDVGPGSVVGILGIGGLGGFGVLFSKAIGAAVIDLPLSKRTGHAEAMDKYTNKLTHILCTGVDEVFTWSF
ncbi:hypothetical protein G6F37_008720 [Rhizopus arrhizus]|nr:hypothetical protein G6F38_010266 [Rhizopus arrhizus]KAG1155243.1 hypothetical protein G6F37_008720 [Rhizopus arrhizus]